jgi:DNA modification methylase
MAYTSPNPAFYATQHGETDERVLGTEENTLDYISRLIQSMDQVHRVLKPTGSLWLQMSDHFYTKTGTVMMIPEQTAFNMIRRGWHLMCPCIWSRSSVNVKDPGYERIFIRDWEYLYWFVKDADKYYFNENCGMNKTSVFEYPYIPPKNGEFASGYPHELVDIAIESTCPPNGTILDPFMGTGVTGLAALPKNRYFIGIEINPEMVRKAQEKLEGIRAI